MTHVAEIRMRLDRISEMERLVARQVERVFVLRAAHLNCRQAETRLSELCSALALQRSRLAKTLSALRATRPDEKSLKEGSDVSGPRWRIGWAAIL